MREALAKLGRDNFIQTHRSHAINLDYVTPYGRKLVNTDRRLFPSAIRTAIRCSPGWANPAGRKQKGLHASAYRPRDGVLRELVNKARNAACTGQGAKKFGGLSVRSFWDKATGRPKGPSLCNKDSGIVWTPHPMFVGESLGAMVACSKPRLMHGWRVAENLYLTQRKL